MARRGWKNAPCTTACRGLGLSGVEPVCWNRFTALQTTSSLGYGVLEHQHNTITFKATEVESHDNICDPDHFVLFSEIVFNFVDWSGLLICTCTRKKSVKKA